MRNSAHNNGCEKSQISTPTCKTGRASSATDDPIRWTCAPLVYCIRCAGFKWLAQEWLKKSALVLTISIHVCCRESETSFHHQMENLNNHSVSDAAVVLSISGSQTWACDDIIQAPLTSQTKQHLPPLPPYGWGVTRRSGWTSQPKSLKTTVLAFRDCFISLKNFSS